MPRTILLSYTIAVLCAATAFATVVYAETTKDTVLDWKFSDEIIQLFDPPMDATIEQMRTWADRLERPIPDDTGKWGGFEKYREQVAYLRIDIAKQIIAAKPDDVTLSEAYSQQWFPYYTLAAQDRTKIPLFEKFYEELKQQNDWHGRKFDPFTRDIMIFRVVTVIELLRFDKKYLTQAEELLAEYVLLLEGKPLGKNAEPFYGNKFRLLNDLSKHGEKYQSAFDTFKEEMREILNTRENELETARFYFDCIPSEPYTTPEGQAAHRAWMERIARRITVMEDAHERRSLYRFKGIILGHLFRNDAATEEEYRAYIKELEAQTGKDDAHSGYMHEIFTANSLLFSREIERLLNSDTMTDEALQHFFASARYMLHHTESLHGHGGQNLSATFYHLGDRIFARCSPEQQVFFIETSIELLAETEKVEEEWIATGKPMSRESELPLFRGFLGRLQLAGQEISLTGTTLDGKPFDLKSLRGKIVLLDFWATWCGPCIAEIPGLQELYEAYHARGFEVVGISIDMESDKATLVEFVQSRQLPWLQLHDPKRELFYQVHGKGVRVVP